MPARNTRSKPAARKPARRTSTTIVVRNAPHRASASRAASLSVISPFDSDGFECTSAYRGFAPITYEDLQKKILSEYACKLRALYLQKKNFTNALVCKYGPKAEKKDEPIATNKIEAEYLQNSDLRIQQLSFDTSQRLQKEQFKSNWTKGDVAIRQNILGPDMDEIATREKKYGPKGELSKAILKGRLTDGSITNDYDLVGDSLTTKANELFKEKRANFGDYDYRQNSYENFLDYY
jgi:hypothetical protein